MFIKNHDLGNCTWASKIIPFFSVTIYALLITSTSGRIAGGYSNQAPKQQAEKNKKEANEKNKKIIAFQTREVLAHELAKLISTRLSDTFTVRTMKFHGQAGPVTIVTFELTGAPQNVDAFVDFTRVFYYPQDATSHLKNEMEAMLRSTGREGEIKKPDPPKPPVTVRYDMTPTTARTLEQILKRNALVPLTIRRKLGGLSISTDIQWHDKMKGFLELIVELEAP